MAANPNHGKTMALFKDKDRLQEGAVLFVSRVHYYGLRSLFRVRNMSNVRKMVVFYRSN